MKPEDKERAKLSDGPSLPIMPFARHGRHAARVCQKLLEDFPEPLHKIVVMEMIAVGVITAIAIDDQELQRKIILALVEGVTRRLGVFNTALHTAETFNANAPE